MTRLLTLAVRNFRNIEQADLSFPHDGIALIGENGHGKTNLLEAIYYLQILRSMRGARDQELVRFDAPVFFIEARVSAETPPREHTIAGAFERQSKRKKVVCDGAVPARLSDALGALPSVVISPRDTEIVAGAPSERRRFLDVLLSLTSRRYLTSLQAYRAALANRNAALRNAIRRDFPRRDRESASKDSSNHRNDTNTIAVWEPTLAEHGAYLMAARWEWVTQNAAPFSQLCAAIGEREPVRMRYSSTVDSPDNAYQHLLDALERKRPLDIKRGITHVGPHRDDLSITLGTHDLRTFGSAGQQRTSAIALRMLEASALNTHHGTPPVLLLDDPFAELDARRSAHIFELLKDAGIGQTILAVPRSTDIPRELTTLDRWHISSGTITTTDPT